MNGLFQSAISYSIVILLSMVLLGSLFGLFNSAILISSYNIPLNSHPIDWEPGFLGCLLAIMAFQVRESVNIQPKQLALLDGHPRYILSHQNT